ncbi:MAG: hypothetical protein ACYC1D_07835 [Acidimicrobiales bacterium]
MTSRRLRVPYDGACTACRKAVPAGSPAVWDKDTRSLTCETCLYAPSAQFRPTAAVEPVQSGPAIGAHHAGNKAPHYPPGRVLRQLRVAAAGRHVRLVGRFLQSADL